MSPKLPLGEYTVKERKHQRATSFQIKEWKVTIQNEKEVVKVEAENEKILGSLQIIKMDDKDQTETLSRRRIYIERCERKCCKKKELQHDTVLERLR